MAAVRKASRSALAEATLSGLRQLQYHGTTTVEAKSGYGLSFEAEMKSLEALRQAMRLWPGKVVPTLLAAHVVPPERQKNPNRYIKEIIQQMIPAAAKRKLAEFVDVFCEQGAFSVEQAEAIFEAAAAKGLRCRAHVGQFTACSLQPLLQQEPASLDHLDYINESDIKLLASTGTVATLVPGANYFLSHERYPDARKMIGSGVAVALATDYNPGSSPTPNMQFILSLACTHMGMSPAEAIAAATINGAHALLLAESKGTIEAGKDADLALFQVKDYR
jgi:imidazolonepropionase